MQATVLLLLRVPSLDKPLEVFLFLNELQLSIVESSRGLLELEDRDQEL
jgi:hypothetical protein